MDDNLTTQKLLILRKQTRAVADFLRAQAKDYLITLGPLLRPRVLLDHLPQTGKESIQPHDKIYQELARLYEKVATAKPFSLTKDLNSAIEIINPSLELTPAEYFYTARNQTQEKAITITQPTRWVVSHTGFAPKRLRELLAERNRSSKEIQEFVLHYLVIHMVMTKQTGVTKMLQSLGYTVELGQSESFGSLPLTYISTAVSTVRPGDGVIIESTEVSGMPSFEEIIKIEDIERMQNKLQADLLALIRAQSV